MDPKEYEFQKTIKRIKQLKGSGTQLVSVYIPANYPIAEIANRLRSEISQAENIKSKQTRTKVIGALERILNVLKGFRQTPPNGLIIFSGDVSEDPSRENIVTITLEPIKQLNQSIYRCDSTFYLEPLENMIQQRDKYGILVMDGREATVALLDGSNYYILDEIESHAHAKIRKGGQSARRFERLIEEQTEYYYKKVAESIDTHFLNRVKGIIVAGPGPTKEYFIEAKHYNYQHKILGVVDTGYTGIEGVREAIEKSKDIIQEQEMLIEIREINRFIREIVNGGKATYGIDQTIDAIRSKRAELVLVSSKLDIKVYIDESGQAHFTPVENYREVLDIQDYLYEISNDNNIPILIISSNSHEADVFLNTFAGVGAILRY
ncbi:MAG: peptide chain release factor aRF-1 [Candidatus Micrarchaeota archaeon]|nr:peptide chain release factor aRF-1 [Candidatus Micrarchaeota archaeon]MCX8154576.1 peptide chain release factor aRF-1 [Candidatus Micrarchaeota archaeon]